MSPHGICVCHSTFCLPDALCMCLLQVLSVNPDDIDGPLIMAPVRDNDPHQLWHQDHWRQFGNAKVKNCIKVNGKEVIKGITETDHVNKEACVLISKSSRRLLCCGGRDQLLRLADYARGADGDAVRRAVVLDMVICSLTATSKLCNSCKDAVITLFWHTCYTPCPNGMRNAECIMWIWVLVENACGPTRTGAGM